MPDPKYLKAGEVADPFDNRVQGKAQDRVPQGNAAPPRRAAAMADDEKPEGPRRKPSIFMPSTRLAKY